MYPASIHRTRARARRMAPTDFLKQALRRHAGGYVGGAGVLGSTRIGGAASLRTRLTFRHTGRWEKREEGPGMSGGTAAVDITPRGAPARSRLAAGVIAGVRGLALCVLALVGGGLVMALPLALGGTVHAFVDSTRGFVLGFAPGFVVTPAVVAAMRPLTNLTRRWRGGGVACQWPFRTCHGLTRAGRHASEVG